MRIFTKNRAFNNLLKYKNHILYDIQVFRLTIQIQ